jgi:hypothetical protein
MARARNIKPGFFYNDRLVELPFEFRLLFIGLWTLADREGRLEDRPKKIKMEIFPADVVDVDAGLAALAEGGFVARYEAAGKKCVQILAWAKHQNPHQREAESILPAMEVPKHSQGDVESQPRPVEAEETPEQARLIPSSLIPDSGLSDSGSLIPDPLPTATASARPSADPAPSSSPVTPIGHAVRAIGKSSDTWKSYSAAYGRRYAVDPVRNAKVNAQLAQFVDRVGAAEAPEIAAFFVNHPSAYYGTRGHSIACLLADAEKLRTEWATNRTINGTTQRRQEATAANPFLALLDGTHG